MDPEPPAAAVRAGSRAGKPAPGRRWAARGWPVREWAVREWADPAAARAGSRAGKPRAGQGMAGQGWAVREWADREPPAVGVRAGSRAGRPAPVREWAVREWAVREWAAREWPDPAPPPGAGVRAGSRAGRPAPGREWPVREWPVEGWAVEGWADRESADREPPAAAVRAGSRAGRPAPAREWPARGWADREWAARGFRREQEPRARSRAGGPAAGRRWVEPGLRRLVHRVTPRRQAGSGPPVAKGGRKAAHPATGANNAAVGVTQQRAMAVGPARSGVVVPKPAVRKPAVSRELALKTGPRAGVTVRLLVRDRALRLNRALRFPRPRLPPQAATRRPPTSPKRIEKPPGAADYGRVRPVLAAGAIIAAPTSRCGQMAPKMDAESRRLSRATYRPSGGGLYR